MRLAFALIFPAMALCGVGTAATNRNGADDARQTLRVYLTCIVKDAAKGEGHARLVAFLSIPAGDPSSGAVAQSLATPDCLQAAATRFSYISKLQTPPLLLRGAAFRALYLQSIGPSHRPAVQPEEIIKSWSNLGPIAVAMRNFGDCVVVRNHGRSDEVVRAAPGSDAETAAYKELGPAFAQCVGPGSTLRFSRTTLEALLAEGLYRQASGVAPAATATEVKKDG